MIYEFTTDKRWVATKAEIVTNSSGMPAVRCWIRLFEGDAGIYIFTLSKNLIDYLSERDAIVVEAFPMERIMSPSDEIHVRCVMEWFVPWLEREGVLVEFEREMERYWLEFVDHSSEVGSVSKA